MRKTKIQLAKSMKKYFKLFLYDIKFYQLFILLKFLKISYVFL